VLKLNEFTFGVFTFCLVAEKTEENGRGSCLKIFRSLEFFFSLSGPAIWILVI
jgi:hypothetical protein